MATVVPSLVFEKSALADDAEFGPDEERIDDAVPPLGKPEARKKFWFQKSKDYDPDGIATQV